jgi:peptide/nickel transport system substrate-binding protein
MKDKNQIILHYWPDERVLGPSIGMPAFALVFCPPFTWNEEGEPVGWLVESWEHSPDYRTWTYHLYKNIHWHDGVPMTSEDVKFSFEILSHPEVLGIKPDSFEFETIDDYSYSITYKDKSLNPLEDYTFFFPRHLLKDLDPKDFENWDFWTQPVGNGPYRYVRHVPKTMLELEANPDYFREKPKIEKVVLRFAGDKLIELIAGNVDAFWENMVFDLIDKENYRMYFKVGGYNALNWNHKTVFFRDRQVWKALTLAINRRELFQLFSLPENIPIADAPLTRHQLLSGNIPEPIPYDPDLAREILEKSGWVDRNGDGVRELSGEDFNFTVITTSNPLGQKTAVFIQDQLRRIGVKMEIQSLAASVVRNRYSSGDYEAALYRGGNLNYYVESEDGPSPTGYKNLEFQNVMNKFRTDFSPDAEDRLNINAWRIFQEDAPATFLAPSFYVTVAHKKIKGLKTPSRVWPEMHMEHLWIEEEK